jgi:phosphoadenosine phosphosulfate reductase
MRNCWRFISGRPVREDAEARRHQPHALSGDQSERLHLIARQHDYDSVPARQACCRVRKLEPLKRALAGQSAWVTGLRAEQSVTRAELPAREWDAANGLEKINPLADWSEHEVWAFIRHHRVPYNPLHDQGYPSIGCAPCTRAITVGEDVRAGRWWWETPETKECGLHRREFAPRPPSATPAIERDRSAA